MRKRGAPFLAFAVVAIALVGASGAPAVQWTADKPGSDNIELVAHLPLGADGSVSDIEIEQDMSRPYAYVAREVLGDIGEMGMDIIDLHDPYNAKVVHRWRIENQDLHVGGLPRRRRRRTDAHEQRRHELRQPRRSDVRQFGRGVRHPK